MKNAIAYYRVSTKEQGESKLGLEAQEHAVNEFANREGYNVIAAFSEVMSSRKKDRPELLAALAHCKKHRATLIVAKLDRLGRSVSLIANLMDQNTDFRAVDNPNANKPMIQMLAVFSEYERDQISERTKAGLAAAKRNGIVLGRYAKEVLGAQISAAAIEFAEKNRPIFEEIQTAGFKSIRALCDELNRRKIPTYRAGGKWHYPSVRTMLKRIKENEKANV